MKTINGKLVTPENNQLDSIQQKTENVVHHCQKLSSQFSSVMYQKDARYIQEMQSVKTCIQQLNMKMNNLEQKISKQSQQFLLLKICNFLGLASLWFWLGMTSQARPQEIKPQNHTSSLKIQFQETNTVSPVMMRNL